MAKRITNEDIVKINDAYLLCGTYSGAAAATGWSASTVKKYIIPNYQSSTKQIYVEIDIPSIQNTIQYLQSTKDLSAVTSEEEKDLANLWKEMLV